MWEQSQRDCYVPYANQPRVVDQDVTLLSAMHDKKETQIENKAKTIDDT